jgi:hypothetical protein
VIQHFRSASGRRAGRIKPRAVRVAIMRAGRMCNQSGASVVRYTTVCGVAVRIAAQSQMTEGKLLDMLQAWNNSPRQRRSMRLRFRWTSMRTARRDDSPPFAPGELAEAHLQHWLAFYFDRS